MNYERYGLKAFEKIKQYGSECKVIRSGAMVYDSSTNSYIDSGTEYLGYALQTSYNQNVIDGTNIKIGDIMLMCVLDGVPQRNDSIIFGNKKYSIVSVSEVNPNGQKAIYYKIQAR